MCEFQGSNIAIIEDIKYKMSSALDYLPIKVIKSITIILDLIEQNKIFMNAQFNMYK